MPMLMFKPKSMQWKIAFLIISFLVYVAGIRNGGSSSSSGTNYDDVDNGHSPATPILSNFFPSEPFTQMPETQPLAARQSSSHTSYSNANGFRPSQIIDFTHSDAADSLSNKYPPSYLAPSNYQFKLGQPQQQQNQAPQQQQQQHFQSIEKQFSFPSEAQQQQVSGPYLSYQSQSTTAVPTQLQTTPIVTYVDPYTIENYQHTSQLSRPIQESSMSSTYYQREEQPQSFTVQSSLLVGPHQRPSSLNEAHNNDAGEIYLKRPGYVFDDGPPMYATHNQRQPTAQSIGFLPTRPPPTPRQQSTRLPPTPPPIRNQKISYDSHDYPPPSYSHQQTSNFVQLPQRYGSEAHTLTQYKPQTHKQRIDYNINNNSNNNNNNNNQFPLAASASSSSSSSSIYESSYAPNYANNFGNYLQGTQQQQQQYPGNYKRPPAQPPRPPYSPQAAINYHPLDGTYTRPPPSNRPSNFYEYQIGEIPPPQDDYNYRPPYRPQQQQQQHQQQLYQYQHQPYRPPTPPSEASSGLATLASLFGATQQYAPQFTNLLLGGVGGAGGAPGATASSAINPLGSLLGALTGTAESGGGGGSTHSQYYGGGGGGGGGGGVSTPARPLNTQLIRALENIARNDDLQCVPKVLCQMIAAQTQRGQLPAFITSPAITNFLAGFPAASPALIYGRAALLGISGGERSCTRTYEQCPKNEYEILYYLNNHRGGFFKFFSEPDEHTAAQQIGSGGGGGGVGGGAAADGSTSLFSILSALTGNSVQQSPATTPRPKPPRPTAATPDIADGIGNFFTRVLSEYLSGVEYQRRRRRRRRRSLRDNYATEMKADIEQEMTADFHDEEDDLDTRDGIRFLNTDEEEAEEDAGTNEAVMIGVFHFPDESDARILHKDVQAATKFFPDTRTEQQQQESQTDENEHVIFEFNRGEAQRKLRFPREQSTTINEKPFRFGKQFRAENAESGGWKVMNANSLYAEHAEDKRRGKRVVFRDTNEESAEYAANDQFGAHTEHKKTPSNIKYDTAEPPRHGRVIFPDHYERFIRKGRILTKPTYAPTYENYVRDYSNENDRFVVSDSHRTEGTTQYDQNENTGTYYSETNSNYLTNSQQAFMNYGEYMPSNSNALRPTYRPNYAQQQSQQHYDYPNTNYVSNNRYSSNYQAATKRPRHEDDKNIYVNNAHGVTEFYITPNGGKVYL